MATTPPQRLSDEVNHRLRRVVGDEARDARWEAMTRWGALQPNDLGGVFLYVRLGLDRGGEPRTIEQVGAKLGLTRSDALRVEREAVNRPGDPMPLPFRRRLT